MNDLLVCHPGADFSTADVHRGLMAGLAAAGVTTHEYQLSMRLSRSADYFMWAWRKAGKPEPRPSVADIAYLAGKDLVERALRWDVRWVLIVSGMFLHPDTLVLLRRAGRKVAVLLTESPYDIEQELRFAALANVVWTNERTCVPAFQRVCARSHYLPHAYDAARHTPGGDIPADVPRHDVVFVGTGFMERVELLRAVDWTGIDLGLYGNWDLLGSRSALRRYLRGGTTPNDRTLQLYQAAKIGLNLHRQSKGWGRTAPRISGAESLNPRAYELAACGCFTVSDHRAEVHEVFGDLVPTATTPKTLEAEIRQWLADDRGRERVRAQLPVAVADHTWTARARQVLADLEAADAAMRAA